MENYDERMNYSFEPADGSAQYHAENQAPKQEPSENKPKHSKKTTAKLIALVLVVALLGSVGGSVLTSVIGNIQDKNTASVATMADASTDSSASAGSSAGTDASASTDSSKSGSYSVTSTPLPTSLSSNSGDKSLTPSEVYSMNINAVVGISTEVTTNVWGQTTTAACSGSGFILSADGYVVTNNHVIEDANEGSIKVTLYNGDEYDATVVGTDSVNDVALLKIDATGLQAVTVADSDNIEVGEEVIAIGNPLGELTFTMTQGYISALDREINTDGTPINMMQTDAAINSGNSGGPLFDMNGNVVGITTAKYSGSTSTGTTIEGIGFAIPINDVLKIVYDLQENGYVTGRAYLGVSVRDLDSSTASTYNLPVGPYVQSVNTGSCAEKAGIQQGDIITSFNGTDITSYTDLVAALQKVKAGDTVKMTVYRSGKSVDLTITLDERPKDVETTTTDTTTTDGSDQTQPQITVPGDGSANGSDGTYGFSFGYGNGSGN